MSLYTGIKSAADRIFAAWVQLRDNVGLTSAEAADIQQELLTIANQMEAAVNPPTPPPPAP